MKKISLLIMMFICMFAFNVKADMGPPVVVPHEVVVTNKDGAACYEYQDSKMVKSSKVIPYQTTLRVFEDIMDGSYLLVESETNEEYNCEVRYVDISAKSQSFDMNDDEVKKIDAVNAIILAKGGLNMRKGPSVTYSKIMTVPQYAIVKLTHNAGDYWYRCEYNGKTGWITGMDGYFGYDGKEVLYSYQEMKIYSTYDRKAVVGKIPANTEITDYINLVSRSEYDISHYVVYNGVKGYIERMMYKTDGTGKIKLIKDLDVEEEGIKMRANQELEYTMTDGYDTYYFPEKKLRAYVPSDYFQYVNKVNTLTKTKGFIGEGLYGEEKGKVEVPTETNETPELDEPKEDVKQNNNSGMSTKDIIIICLLGGIFLSLTAIVIIKLMNSKKNKQVVNYNYSSTHNSNTASFEIEDNNDDKEV